MPGRCWPTGSWSASRRSGPQRAELAAEQVGIWPGRWRPCDFFGIVIEARRPVSAFHQGSVVIAAALVQSLQSIVSHHIDGAIRCAIGDAVHAGSAYNVIPGGRVLPAPSARFFRRPGGTSSDRLRAPASPWHEVKIGVEINDCSRCWSPRGCFRR